MTSGRTRRLLAACAFTLLAAEHPARAGEPGSSSRQALSVADLQRATPVDFQQEVLPILKNNCLACHNTTKAKAGLNLETPEFMRKGGDSGPAVVPGKAAESLLFKAAAHRDPELTMPPADNKVNASALKPDQLALLKLWIDQGAKGEVRVTAPVNWLPHPPVLDPILAVALTQDGQFAACGRGNRIDLYHLPSSQHIARLADTRLGSVGLADAAHRDFVNALAFNPDGTLLASAGYREVKLWRRLRHAQRKVTTTGAMLFAVSPDRKWLATLDTDQGIVLTDLASGQIARTLRGPANAVTSLKFAPDSQRLLSGSTDKTVRVWNISDGTLIASVETSCAVNAVTWADDGQRIVAGGADGIIRVWFCRSRHEEARTSSEKSRSLVPSAPSIKLVKELEAGTAAVTALDTLPGGGELISASADGTVRHWKLDDGKVTCEFKHDGLVCAVALRPDGKRCASASTKGFAKLWNTADGKPVAELKGDRYAYEHAADTERALVVAKSDVEFRKKSLDAAQAEHKKQTERVAKATETNSVTEKLFTEKDKAFKDGQAAKAKAEKALADLLGEIERVTKSFERAEQDAKDAAAHAKAASEKAAQAQVAAERAVSSKGDAERIAAEAASVAAKAQAAADTADAARDTANRIAEESATVAAKSKAFAEGVASDADMKSKLAAEAKAAAAKAIEEVAALAFAAGQLKPAFDKTLAEAPEKRKAGTNQIESATKALARAETEFKRAETRKSVTNHELDLAQQAQKRAAEKLATAKTALADAETSLKETEAALARARRDATALELPTRALAFSPDGLTLATVSEDGRVHTWSAETGAGFDVLEGGVGVSTAPEAEASSVFGGARASSGAGESPALLCIALLDAQTLLAPSTSCQLLVWDLKPTWVLERTIGTGDIDSPLTDRVNAVRFSPDGRMLATGGGEPTRSGEIKLWSVAEGEAIREFARVHSDAVLALDFSPDGKFLASASADRFVRVVELATGKAVKTFEGHTSYVLGVAWKGDSRILASAGADNVIKVWDFIAGERRKNIESASKEVTSIAFVGVTEQMVATSGDGQVRMMRDNGEKVREFSGSDFMNSVAATPDGGLVVAGGQDGTLRVWDGKTGNAVATFAPAK
jgi:WD40 repeat protein